MKLANGELRPGTILEVIDNKGTIKAEVPGLFDKNDIKKLPPIYPWSSGGSNKFSSPSVHDEVWVLLFTDNPEELFWFRKDDFAKNNGSRNTSVPATIQEQQNIEVVASRRTGAGWATIYFSDGSGWIIQNQSAAIKLAPDGVIQISSGQAHSMIEVSDDGISLGSPGGSSHPCPYGDKVADLFDNIIGTMEVIKQAAKGSPYTTAIAVAMEADMERYKDDSQYINSDYITLD